MIPLGRREPGLYLVEAMVGDHRAATLVFVSDSIGAVTKVSSKQMMVWVADRRSGKPVGGAEAAWSDGVGVLASGGTDPRGLLTFRRSSPEKTYIFGEDPQGGVFVSENFYYDSEIYNSKLYAVTDRPLYRPGDTVYVKMLGRAFRSARESAPIAAGEVKLQVFDPNGFPIAGASMQITPQSGADTSFRLPDNAAAGGYELRFTYGGDAYGAAFRVADYQKPHFEINVLPSKRDFRTGDEVNGKLQLVYPDGKPVAGARVELSVRAQRLTMIDGDLGYTGQFPLQLVSADLTTDASGMAPFALPAAKEPSRYVVSVLATDGAAYRVRATKEILVERGAGTFALRAERAFSAAGERVDFEIRPVGDARIGAQPVAWEWVRLENRRREAGEIPAGQRLAVSFPEPGTYTVSVRDASGSVVGATTHHVSGAGVGAPQGSIEMVFDKSAYKPGEIAGALITFPQPVDQALLTLERDQVEKSALLAGATGWVRTRRLSPTQWRAEVRVRDDYGPNITLSVVYVKGADFVFQNLGLRVEQPRVEVAVHADKEVYAPGETVTLDLEAVVRGKPAAGAQLTVGVVDEMIYVLQPEIAPDVFDFFYHPRRNNVRTTASLNFIGYDLAKPPSGAALPSRRQTHERAIKVLERPRREDKDTALWQPTVVADGSGHARVTFVMPDSLTRWRVTVRASNPAGVVGQSVAHVRSDKAFYVKWTSPTWMRTGDTPNAAVAVFNQGDAEATLELAATGPGLERRDTITVKPGANFVSLPMRGVGDSAQVDLTLSMQGRVVDRLAVAVKAVPAHWQSLRSITVPVVERKTALALPADASRVRLQFTNGATAQFRRVMDDLIDYPYGCVEQTSSRLIPYSLALQSVLPSEERLAARLTQQLNSHRFRLAQMAGPQATFGWWSPPEKDADPLLTAYAYFADWHASRALKLELPPGHFDRLIEVYRKAGVRRSYWHRALMLYWMQEMGLPVRSLAEALADEIASSSGQEGATPERSALSSVVLTQQEDRLQSDMAAILAGYVVSEAQGTLSVAVVARLDSAASRLHDADEPLVQSLLLLTGRSASQPPEAILRRVHTESPTIDRALTLLWTYRVLSPDLHAAMASIAVQSPWTSVETATGQRMFEWPAAHGPASLELAAAPAPGTFAVVQFESREAEASRLPVRVQRRIYRMVRVKPESVAKLEVQTRRGRAEPDASSDAATFVPELLPEGAVLKTDEVYLDEVVLTKSPEGAALRYGIVEVALPPGTSADRTTWGISLRFPGAKASEAMERAREQGDSIRLRRTRRGALGRGRDPPPGARLPDGPLHAAPRALLPHVPAGAEGFRGERSCADRDPLVSSPPCSPRPLWRSRPRRPTCPRPHGCATAGSSPARSRPAPPCRWGASGSSSFFRISLRRVPPSPPTRAAGARRSATRRNAIVAPRVKASAAARRSRNRAHRISRHRASGSRVPNGARTGSRSPHPPGCRISSRCVPKPRSPWPTCFAHWMPCPRGRRPRHARRFSRRRCRATAGRPGSTSAPASATRPTHGISPTAAPTAGRRVGSPTARRSGSARRDRAARRFPPGRRSSRRCCPRRVSRRGPALRATAAAWTWISSRAIRSAPYGMRRNRSAPRAASCAAATAWSSPTASGSRSGRAVTSRWTRSMARRWCRAASA